MPLPKPWIEFDILLGNLDQVLCLAQEGRQLDVVKGDQRLFVQPVEAGGPSPAIFSLHFWRDNEIICGRDGYYGPIEISLADLDAILGQGADRVVVWAYA